MAQVHLLGAGISYDTNKQAVEKNQIIRMEGYDKAIAVFGETKPVKEQLKALGGRFNPGLTHEGAKKAGWVFPRSKKDELKNLLTIN
jgi:hypothetical protein